MTALRAGLIGDHISASRLSKALAIMCEEAGLTLDFEMIDSALDPAFDFDATVAACRAKGWTGVTVTHPYKTAAAHLAGDEADPVVSRLGASNTLIFGPKIAAHNTDFSGFQGAWRHVFGPRTPGRVAMAGAGGVARAVGPALADLGAEEIALWDLEPDRAEALARVIGPKARAIPASQAAEAIRAADGLVNATALGMTYHLGSAFDPKLIGPQRWAFDAVYTPTDTAFLITAAEAGLDILSGFDLFRFMAIASFEAYTGLSPDTAATLTALAPLRPQETP